MNVIYSTRVWLIRIGKMLPFILCFVVFISYLETLLSMISQEYVLWEENIIPNCSISWIIGKYFEYDFITLFVFLVISIAIETCCWNKIAILYLLIQLAEKQYFSIIELYEETIYAIITSNLIASEFFVYKGLTILFTKTK